MKSSEELDVLIVGGGIVGLSLAAKLIPLGLKVRILERKASSRWTPPEGFDQRIYALNPSSVDLLKSLCAWQRLDSQRIGQMKQIEVQGDDQAILRFPAGADPLAYIVEEGAVHQALEDELFERYGPSFRKIGTPADLTLQRTHAELTTDQGETLRASLIVGADGVRSWVRDHQKWTTQTFDFQQTAVVMNIGCERSHAGVGRQWFLGGDVVALLPLSDQCVSLVWSTTPADAERWLSAGAEETLKALEARIGRPLGALSPLNQPQGFPLTDITVSPFAEARVALIGDAAHRVHPLAGQGLNLGLGDVLALSQAIAERGPGPDAGDLSVMRRYARSRALPTLLMRSTTRGLHGLFKSAFPGVRELRNLGLMNLNYLPFVKEWLINHASQSHRIPL